MKKSYFAIIPANVRYDKKLTANAKLLYGEITALANEKGYCWASNSYFAELYEVSVVSISKWVNQLAENGYVKTELIYKADSKEIKERRIYIDYPIKEKFNTLIREVKDPIKEKFNTPIKEKFNTPIKEKFKDNSTVFNNTFNNTVEVVVEKETTTTTTMRDVVVAFEQNGFGTISGMVKDELVSLTEDYSNEWVLDAIKESVESNVRNLKYTKAILRRWKAEGKNTTNPKPENSQQENNYGW